MKILAPVVPIDIQKPKSGMTLDEDANCANELVSEIKTTNTFEKVMEETDRRKEWNYAWDSKIYEMKCQEVYELVETPHNRKQIEARWVFIVKEHETWKMAKCKARWVVRG